MASLKAKHSLFVDAINLYQKAYDADPEYDFIPIRIAMLYVALSLYEEAISYYCCPLKLFETPRN